MWLLIDDIRDLNCEVTARTPEAGKKMLAVGGWDCVCLDHDLAADETGYDIAVWALEAGIMPPKVQIVSSNPVGKKNISDALKNNGYTTKNGTDFSCA